jgi:hypothetical protein
MGMRVTTTKSITATQGDRLLSANSSIRVETWINLEKGMRLFVCEIIYYDNNKELNHNGIIIRRCAFVVLGVHRTNYGETLIKLKNMG